MSDPQNIFDQLKQNILNLDPVAFCQQNLMLDGKPFRLIGNGYKPMADIYRYIGIKALEKTSKPIVIVKGRQTSATTMACALSLYFMSSGIFGSNGRPPIRVIHAFPLLEHSYTYSKTKLSALMSASRIVDKNGKPISYVESMLDTSSPTNNSLQFKQFSGSNWLMIESTGDNADRLRGRTADVLLLDEAQDVRKEAIANTTKILTKAQYGQVPGGVQVYFGTPKQRGSALYDMWQKSSQQYYHLHCENCDKFFPLYTPGSNEWENIWIRDHIVECIHCKHQQDKIRAAEHGKWIASKDSDECQYIGFHINQLYIPDFTKEKIILEKPENNPNNTEKTYFNEVLGEFWSGETGIITPEQIRDKCGDAGRKFRASIAPGEETMTLLGIDIGAKSDLEQLADTKSKAKGQSYSCFVVMTLSGQSRLSIEAAGKFLKNDFASKKERIDQLMRQYSVNLAVCDLGYTHDLSDVLQNEYGDRFLVSTAAGRVNDHVKYADDIFPKTITFERDYYIAELYEQMKKGNIRFPWGDYEKIAWFVQHCTSMEIKPTVSRTGEIAPHYIKGTTPNDGFMALLNAYLAYKFLITKAFTVFNPLMFNNPFEQKKNKNTTPIISGYIPRMR